MPGIYHWAPYVANIVAGLSYKPSGQQAIDSIQQIPKSIPIVIVHSKDDPVTPYSGSKALYYARKCKAGAKNVYHISVDGPNHTNILEGHYNPLEDSWKGPDIIRFVPEIYTLLKPGKVQDEEVIKEFGLKYQPKKSSPEDKSPFGKKEYEQLMKREKGFF